MINLCPKRDFSAKKAVILGSTGSVGTQALDIVRELGIEVTMLAAGENTTLLAEQIREFSPKTVAVGSESAAKRLKSECDFAGEIIFDKNEVYSAIRETDADVIVHAVSGLLGIGYALAASESGKRVAMANKEAIISVGDIICDKLEKYHGEMIPVDSEHSAIYRCLSGHADTSEVKKILLTASGGPFLGYTKEELSKVTVEKALEHPTWKMGRKITVDSATLMNKGFEIIEAVRLFGVTENKIEVLIHPQSIIHSMVEYNDNTVIAQMGRPDMRDCVRYAMTAPKISSVIGEGLDFAKIGSLIFSSPDTEAFPLLEAARTAINMGGCAPTALIAADEEAVDAFLKKQIGFTDISSLVIETLENLDVSYDMSIEAVAESDKAAREMCRAGIAKIKHYM